jgi:hypothetical protein
MVAKETELALSGRATRFTDQMTYGMLRHATSERLRDDKSPQEMVRDIP